MVSYTWILLLCFAMTVRSDRAHRPASPNSKFLDPQLDDQANLQEIKKDYDVTSKEKSEPFNIMRDGRENDEVKSFGHQSKYGLASLALPFLSFVGLFNGGSYGAQYYGLAATSNSGWKLPFFNHQNYDNFKSELRQDTST